MPGYIERLHSSLLNIAVRSFPSAEFIGKPEVMAEELERVRVTFNRQANAAPSEDRIFRAIADFIQARGLENGDQARLIAWGLAVPRSQQEPLLEINEAFSWFLDEVRQIWERDELSVNTWR